MRTQVVEGSPKEVAEQIQRIDDRRIVAVVVRDDLASAASSAPGGLSDKDFQRLMDELQADSVAVGHVVDSREAIYTRMEGE
jgi:hypothetical protein